MGVLWAVQSKPLYSDLKILEDFPPVANQTLSPTIDIFPLLAAKAGATYVSPFIGRLDDISTDGLDLISDIRDIYDNYAYETEILAASIRHTMHIIDCAKIGADVITSPLSAIKGLLKHPLTDIGLAKFLSDYKKGN